MFEDLGVIEAQRKYGRAGEGGKTEALWPQLRGDQLGDLVTQLAVVIEVLGQPAKTVQKKDKDKDKDGDGDGACVEKKKDGKDNEGGTEVDGFWIPEENKPEEIPPSGLDVEINSQKPGGGWDTWRTVIPKEGECDGALGAAVGILNALCTHPVLFHVIDGHPRLHDVIRAVTRASASQCSCAWATFSCVVNLSTRAAKCDEETGDPVHVLGDALLTSPSAGHLLRGTGERGVRQVADHVGGRDAAGAMPPAAGSTRTGGEASAERDAQERTGDEAEQAATKGHVEGKDAQGEGQGTAAGG